MNDVMERVRAHFEGKETKMIAVPEWGEPGQPLMVYATPMTLEQQNRLLKKVKSEGELVVMVELLIMKAKKADGSAMFTLADKPELLRKADPGVITRVAAEIIGNADDFAEAEKNFGKPQT